MSGRMHVSEAVRRMEVFTGEGRRRSWSAAEKAAIVAESYDAFETVCGVARRHGLTPQQLFTWRRLARDRITTAGEVRLFVPAVVEAVRTCRGTLAGGDAEATLAPAFRCGRDRA